MVRRKASSAVARGMDRQTDIALHKNTGSIRRETGKRGRRKEQKCQWYQFILLQISNYNSLIVLY